MAAKRTQLRLGTVKQSETEATKYNFMDTISSKELREYRRHEREILNANTRRQLLLMVEHNYHEFFRLLDGFIEQQAKTITNITHQTDIESTDNLMLHANRVLFSFLSSKRTFIDHMEVDFKKRFGEDSHEFKEFKTMLSYFFENSFAYRFCYQLRNYAQHCGLPLTGFQLKLTNDKPTGRIKLVLSINFSPKSLLNDYKGWKRVKTDLEEMKKDFSALIILQEEMHNVREIARNIELLNKERVSAAITFINNLIQHIDPDAGEPAIFTIKGGTEENLEKAKMQIIQIPFHLMEQIVGSET